MPADPGQLTGLESFPALRQELDRCMKCGFCMSVCPVYNAEKSEAGVARGKITIAEAEIVVEPGELDPDEIHTPGIFVHRLVHNPNPEKRIERRTVREG